MAKRSERRSPFNQVFDVVVVGSGHAGYSAAVTLRRTGRSVLLVGSRGDLVWESGRGFCPDAGTCADAGWQTLVDAVAQRGGLTERWMDGAITEVVATDQLVASGAMALYYARPVAVERDDDAVASVVVATKSGLRRVAGRQWVDATETGELLRLLEPALIPREPARTRAYMMLQHPVWAKVNAGPAVRTTAWPGERVIGVEVRHGDPAWREQVLAGLAELEGGLGADMSKVSMSHVSIEPVPQYEADVTRRCTAANVVSAAPSFTAGAVTTLAERFALGVQAVADLDGLEIHEVRPDVLTRPLPRVEPTRTLRTDVCVAGVGTGGALAALAAAKAGAKVVCVEPLAFVGGIGAGGGIHGYWYGVAGGLQRDVDRRTRTLMKRFHGGPLGDGPFNPWAKMIALEQMLREQNIDLHTDAQLFDVEMDGDRVAAAMVATAQGVLRIEASAYVDGTGDGDLCATAGATFADGREHDGMLHAYSQSSGMLRDLHGRPRMAVVNFDAGFCDPTDPHDITRARLTGVRQYLLNTYDNFTRPTYIAPALGLRQGRQVVTEYVLTLDDQVRRSKFDDPIGYTGAHYDNHGTDYEFESDEAVFWVWINRQFTRPIACEMSYRMLVPRGLSNVWIGSRCLGLTQDAHYATRMQRDIQRVGEAAGFAAAEAASHAETKQQLSYDDLRKWLDQTGALDKKPRNVDTSFGTYSFGGSPLEPAAVAIPDGSITAAKALAALDRGVPGEAIWWLYRQETLVHDAVLERLADRNRQKPMVSWLAACILAMWNDPAAEPRLIKAIDTREYGFGEGYEWTPHSGAYKPETSDPLAWNQVVPNWLSAVAMLRRCGSQACLPSIERLIDRPVHGINTLTSVAITLERLVQAGVVKHEEARNRVEAMVDRILAIGVVGADDYAARHVGRYSERAIRGELDAQDDVHPQAVSAFPAMINANEDNTWQLHLSVSRARAALGLSMHDTAVAYQADDRALVRRAFSAITSESVPIVSAERATGREVVQ